MPLMTASIAQVTPMTLRRWAQAGKMVAIDRGIYIPTDESDQDHLELAAAVMRRPEGVIVLLSALHLHGIGTHIPQSVWLAVPPGVANHRTNRRVRILRWSKERLAEGIESRSIAGVTVRITTPAKTIVDCFRCPRQISREGALEALREGLANGITPADIAAVAQRDHVLSIRPILEALT